MLSIVALLPAVAYSVATLLALTVDSQAPTKWLRDLFEHSPGAIFGIWSVLVGGPTLSLIIQMSCDDSARSRIQKSLAVLTWLLLLWCLVSTVPFPWFFLAD